MKLSLETVASFTGRGFVDVNDVVAQTPVHPIVDDDDPDRAVRWCLAHLCLALKHRKPTSVARW
jgi:hypothetical protein